MSTGPPRHIPLPAPSFPQGPQVSSSPKITSPNSHKLPRISFGARSYRRPSQPYRAKFDVGDEEIGGHEEYAIGVKPAIPSALPEQGATPLPVLPMIVLSIVSSEGPLRRHAALTVLHLGNVGRVFIGQRIDAFPSLHGRR